MGKPADPPSVKKQPTGDYEVGYCRTPAASRWRRGESGNPRGPRKKANKNMRDFLEILRDEFSNDIIATEGGKAAPISVMRVIAKQLLNDLLKGTPPQRLKVLNKLIELQVLQPGALQREFPKDAIADLVKRLAAETDYDPVTGALREPPLD